MTLPFENDTRIIVKKLAKADLKEHKLKTLITAIIIVIATCLMATVFSILVNDALKQSTQAPYHAMFRAVSEDTKNKLQTDNDFETVHEANHNEAMTIYDVLCYSKDRCHLSHEFVNINSLSSVRTGNLSPNRGFFQNTADFFNGKTVELRNACISLSGKELEKGDVAFKLNLFPFLPIIIRFWEADDEFPASLQILADRNTLDYMHYETLMFALTHLFSRLKEEMRIEKG